jgi:hypothetical protein
MHDLASAGSNPIKSGGITAFAHQQASIMPTPQRFGFPQIGQFFSRDPAAIFRPTMSPRHAPCRDLSETGHGDSSCPAGLPGHPADGKIAKIGGLGRQMIGRSLLGDGHDFAPRRDE